MTEPDDAVKQIATRGFTRLPTKIPSQLIRTLQLAAHNVIKGLDDNDVKARVAHLWNHIDGLPFLFKVKPIISRLPQVIRILKILVPIAEAYLDGEVQLIEDKLMVKTLIKHLRPLPDAPRLSGVVARHRDASYFKRRGINGQVISIAVALEPCTATNGALEFWPGSHKQLIASYEHPIYGPTIPESLVPWSDAVLMSAQAGEVLAWDSNTIHAARENTSGSTRLLLVFGFAQKENEYV